jgi:hypothetical protein
MNTNRIKMDDLPNQQEKPQNQEGSADGRWDFYRKALISFLALIVLGAVVGTALSLVFH